MPIGELPDTEVIRTVAQEDSSTHAPGTSIGMTFFAGADSERRLLELAYAFEQGRV